MLVGLHFGSGNRGYLVFALFVSLAAYFLHPIYLWTGSSDCDNQRNFNSDHGNNSHWDVFLRGKTVHSWQITISPAATTNVHTRLWQYDPVTRCGHPHG